MQFYQTIGFTKTGDNTLNCKSYEDRFTLGLNKVDSIDRGEAFGRLAMGCHDDDVQNVHDNGGAIVLNAPITLKTEGKADVVVTILQS